jgi:hypothetical protein
MFNTPVLFLLFNRPDTTKQVFEVIRKVKPAKLFIAADGPRKERVGEAELCRQTREFVLNYIDWDCQVNTLFRDENLGCGRAVSEAISWFFEYVEDGIILEDDCLPSNSFFTYCSVLLDRYRFNDKIMHIGGDNFQLEQMVQKGGYYYSSLTHVWGWATWKRAWNKYDYRMNDYSYAGMSSILGKMFRNRGVSNYWLDILNNTKNGYINTWDYQWQFTLWHYGGVSIVPKNNLVSNIGFTADATHTTEVSSRISNMKRHELFDLSDPINKNVNIGADIKVLKCVYGVQTKKYYNLCRVVARYLRLKYLLFY